MNRVNTQLQYIETWNTRKACLPRFSQDLGGIPNQLVEDENSTLWTNFDEVVDRSNLKNYRMEKQIRKVLTKISQVWNCFNSTYKIAISSLFSYMKQTWESSQFHIWNAHFIYVYSCFNFTSWMWNSRKGLHEQKAWRNIQHVYLNGLSHMKQHRRISIVYMLLWLNYMHAIPEIYISNQGSQWKPEASDFSPVICNLWSSIFFCLKNARQFSK